MKHLWSIKLKIIKLLTFFLFITVTLEANYCIQVFTVNSSERNTILNEAKHDKYEPFNDVRVENRGRYLVFRIGDYSRYGDASRDIKDIRKINRDAYVRKCDFVKEKAIYIKDEERQEATPPRYKRQSLPQKRTVKVKAKAVQKKTYKKKEELKYTTNSDSLWGDCKKCFVPIYEEESDIEYDVLKQKPTPRKTRKTSDEIEVKVQTKKPTQESFWSDDIVVEESAPRVRPKPKTRNKFNIDEQFLP